MAGFGSGLVQGLQVGEGINRALDAPRRKALEERAMKVQEGNLNIRRQELSAGQDAAKAQGETDEAQWNRSLMMKPTQAVTSLTAIAKNLPEMGVIVNPILEDLDSGKIETRRDLRTRLMGIRSSGELPKMRATLREKAQKLREKGKNAEAGQIEALYGTMDAKVWEDVIDDVMGKPAGLRRSAQAKGVGMEGKPQVTGGERIWDEKTQSWLQRMSDGSYKKIAQASSKAGSRGVYDREGNLIYGENLEPTKRTVGTLQDEIVTAQSGLDRLDRIVEDFRPEYLTASGKARSSLSNLKEVLLGKGSLTPKQEKFMADQSVHFQTSAEDFNLYIKSITGAQVSAKEAERMKYARANYGKTWFTGDGPTKFLAKTQNSREMLQQAKDRYEYYLTNGFGKAQIEKMMKDGTAAPLSQFKKAKSGGELSVGDVHDGYRYNGGDPNSQQSWSKVKK